MYVCMYKKLEIIKMAFSIYVDISGSTHHKRSRSPRYYLGAYDHLFNIRCCVMLKVLPYPLPNSPYLTFHILFDLYMAPR